MTKAQKMASIKSRLSSESDLAIKVLIHVYEKQTEHEKLNNASHELNGEGFTQWDSEILSSFAVQYQQFGRLSPRQIVVLLRRMPKYWHQALEVVHPSDGASTAMLIHGADPSCLAGMSELSKIEKEEEAER